MVLDGIYYALGLFAGGALLSYVLGWGYGIPFAVLAIFCLYFFRDPDRNIPDGPVAVSPADGKVVSIQGEPPSTRVSIFLNIFDVHVNRSPVAGAIAQVKYQTGKFLVASRELASSQNEQNTVTLKQADGTQVIFSQIAGLIARRIVFRKQPGDTVQKGERVGLIKFGSRVDVYFGPEWEIAVRPGQRVSAGSSVLARRKQPDAVA
jgi:phosphatidylserine decarboxylase